MIFTLDKTVNFTLSFSLSASEITTCKELSLKSTFSELLPYCTIQILQLSQKR